jgi:hypothetical protein
MLLAIVVWRERRGVIVNDLDVRRSIVSAIRLG